MTRKDYILIASTIRGIHKSTRNLELDGEDPEYILGAEQALELLAEDLADKFQGVDQLFDRVKFIEACKHHRDSEGK